MDAIERMYRSLDGLSVGDAFGDQFFLLSNRDLTSLDTPPPVWAWSDDSEMACSVVSCLAGHGVIDQDVLARLFADHFDLGRRYGAGALEQLEQLRWGGYWHVVSRQAFGGKGSYGNGAAMRVAPLGAYFSGRPERAAAEAALQAEITHAHPEGIAGAIAVAVAASVAATAATGAELVDTALAHTPPGYTRRGLQKAGQLLRTKTTAEEAAHTLGNGSRITAQDTVPFTLWAAARHMDDYESGVRACVSVGGDMDTTAAIVGGILATRTDIPDGWITAREPLPAWLTPRAADGRIVTAGRSGPKGDPRGL